MKEIRYVHAFGKIDRVLKNEGFSVYVAKHDGFGTIENNALQIKDEILKILEKENCNKVNIIAHSKGGLDCKYLIKELGMEDYVASLTTICTPHKGSPIASGFLKFPNWILRIIAFWLNLFYRILGDKHPDSLAVCKQLQRVDAIQDETKGFSDKVYCQSYSSRMEKIKDDFVMSAPYIISHFFEKDKLTDGMVPEDSAVWENYRGQADEETPLSHGEIICLLTTKKKKEKVYEFWTKICIDLAQKGF